MQNKTSVISYRVDSVSSRYIFFLIPVLTFKLLPLLALVLVEIGPYRNADVALLMKGGILPITYSAK